MNKTFIIIASGLSLLFTPGFSQNADEILRRVDENLSSSNRVMESQMVIHGRRTSRTITSRTWAQGNERAFTEYLSPPREQGTKMLKLENQLWIYSPSADRVMQISGHMLRQSVMGSDLSYEDMMDDRKLTDTYNATIEGRDEIDGREVFVINLTAKVQDAAYQTQKIWIDTQRYVPLKQEMFARGGQLLKRIELKDVQRIEGRWFPTRMIFKDMLKEGEGTEFIISNIRFDVDIPEHVFTRASLRN